MTKLELLKTSDVLISRSAVDTLLDIRDEAAIRLYIYLAGESAAFDVSAAASRLGISQDAVCAALDILVKKKLVKKDDNKVLERADTIPEYTVGDVSRAIETDASFKYLLNFTQKKLGKVLSTVDTQALLGIYSWMGLPVDVICLIITYCHDECVKKYGEGRRPTMRNIENQARLWLNLGITTGELAENYLRDKERRGTRIAELARILHLSGRALSQTESRYLNAWVEAKFSDELILEAYDLTVVKTGKLSWKYMDTILKSWQSKGYSTIDEVIAGERSEGKEKLSISAEQLAAYERLGELNKKWGSEK